MFELLLLGKKNIINRSPGFGLVIAGQTNGGSSYTLVTEKYTYFNDVLVGGTSLDRNMNSAAGTGNTSVGVFFVATANRSYFYAANALTANGALSHSAVYSGATSNQEIAFFQGSYNGYMLTYTHATQSGVRNTVLSTGDTEIASAGTLTDGFFFGGMQYNYTYRHLLGTYKINYASQTKTSMANLGTARGYGAACFSAEKAYIGGGTSSPNTTGRTVETHQFSNEARSSGSELVYTHYHTATAGNCDVGIFAGGENTASTGTGVKSVSKYTYATDVVSAGTLLSVARKYNAATSSSPGWVLP